MTIAVYDDYEYHNGISVIDITTHMVSIECVDGPKLHDMLKARDAKTRQRKFPVGFPVKVCALKLLFIIIFYDAGVRIARRCVIKAKHALKLLLY